MDGKWDQRWLAVAVGVFAWFVALQGNGLASFLLGGIAVFMFDSMESSKEGGERGAGQDYGRSAWTQ